MKQFTFHTLYFFQTAVDAGRTFPKCQRNIFSLCTAVHVIGILIMQIHDAPVGL